MARKVDPTKNINGRISLIDVSGAGPNSRMLTVTVQNSSTSVTATIGPSTDPKSVKECYPEIFAAFLQIGLTALQMNADVTLGYNPIKRVGNFIQNITARPQQVASTTATGPMKKSRRKAKAG